MFTCEKCGGPGYSKVKALLCANCRLVKRREYQIAYYQRRKDDPVWLDKRRAKNRRWYSNNKDKAAQNYKKWAEKNREYRREYFRERAARLYKSDPVFRQKKIEAVARYRNKKK